MLKKLKDIYYKDLFLYGFYLTFIGLTSIATIVDFSIDNKNDALIDLISVLVASVAFFYYLKTKEYELASIALFWISSAIVFLFVIQNNFDISIIFTLLIPLAAFILLSTKKAIYHIGIYFVLLILIFSYGYVLYENHPMLHQAKHMSAYIIAMLFVIAFGVIYHVAIEQSYKELEHANRQKTFLLKEIHHRVKNNLNIISSIWGIQELENDSEALHELIQQNRLRLESMAMAHEILYQHENFANIEFKTYIEKLSKHILQTESHNDKITINLDIAPLSLSIETMIQFGMMLNELMTNSLKYAFPNHQGTINISLKKEKKGYTFTYGDNGIGLKEQQKPNGFGHSLIEMSIEQLEGELEIINQNGLHYSIWFKGLKNENINC